MPTKDTVSLKKMKMINRRETLNNCLNSSPLATSSKNKAFAYGLTKPPNSDDNERLGLVSGIKTLQTGEIYVQRKKRKLKRYGKGKRRVGIRRTFDDVTIGNPVSYTTKKWVKTVQRPKFHFV